jgi:excinuclease ABC subunit A
LLQADHLIDLGPEGGEKGGRVIAFGTPEQLAKCGSSYTGGFLAAMIKRNAVIKNKKNSVKQNGRK